MTYNFGLITYNFETEMTYYLTRRSRAAAVSSRNRCLLEPNRHARVLTRRSRAAAVSSRNRCLLEQNRHARVLTRRSRAAAVSSRNLSSA